MDPTRLWYRSTNTPILVWCRRCGVRQVKPFPRADKISTGAVPVRSRGAGHMAPTYLVGTMRDLNRPTAIVALHAAFALALQAGNRTAVWPKR
jgi:hypothetical protein